MRRFAQLFEELDATTRTGEKVAALVRYFRDAPAGDGAWALAILTGRRLKRAVNSRRLQEWVAEVSGYPQWLLEECYGAVGDYSETLALVLPEPTKADRDLSLRAVMEERIGRMAKLGEAERKALLLDTWERLEARGKFVFHKLMGGNFRVGVSRLLAVRAMAEVANIPQEEMDHRLMGEWGPTVEFFESLLKPVESGGGADRGLQPYPFFLAHQLAESAYATEPLGERGLWQAEWKWDGIRAQLVRRKGRTALWSRGEELITERFPDLVEAAAALPDGLVLDGEILAWEAGADVPLGFQWLQTRITRKQPTGLLFADVPVVFVAYDVLEVEGVDIRERGLSERRRVLEGVIGGLKTLRSAEPDFSGTGLFRISRVVEGETWVDLERQRSRARLRGVEGLMLKHKDSRYGVGRTKLALVDGAGKAGWWKWKIEPYTVDAVLIGAQRGSGRRASLFTDYTFGVWTGPGAGEGELVPVAKAYHGKEMTDEVFLEIDKFVREHTVKKVPGAGMRVVEPRLVFELAFEGIAESTRHKSGVAVRFPRINRWRRDKGPGDADTLGSLRELLKPKGGGV